MGCHDGPMAIATAEPRHRRDRPDLRGAHARPGRRRHRPRPRHVPDLAPTTAFAERAALMHRAADLLDEDNESIARIMTLEMGKTLKSARGRGRQVREGHALLRRARRGASWPTSRSTRPPWAPRGPTRATRRSGIVLAVMPWNFPLWQVVRFAAPALMAGNVGLLKHASNVPQCALYLEDLFRRAGFPEGAFTTLLIGARDVERVLRDPRVRAATLTGSEPAGQSVAAICGDEIKKTVHGARRRRRLRRHAVGRRRARRRGGGHRALPEQRAVLHRGQAVHRAHRRVRRSSPQAFVARMAALRGRRPDGRRHRRRTAGDRVRAAPTSRSSSTTPAPRAPRCSAAADGPTVPAGSTRPTVVADLTTDMRMYAEEIFGPVAGLYRVGSLDEAVELGQRHELRARLQRLDQRPRRAGPVHPTTSTPARSSSTG